MSDLKQDLPLCVDLDGTLTPTDLLVEHLLVALKKQPWILFLLPLWLFRGKLFFKFEVLRRSGENPTLPLRQEVLDYLRSEQSRGREVYLVTASPYEWAIQVADSLKPLFEGVLATTTDRNLKGKAKADLLVKEFGDKGYIYLGDAMADWPVYQSAKAAIPVGPPSYIQKVAKSFSVEKSFTTSSQLPIKIWLRAIRVHQWAKNLLVFLPIFLSYQLTGAHLGAGLLAFFGFSFMASAIYLLNDLLDLESDRLHPKKASRPLASGQLPLSHGLLASGLLFLCSLGVAVFLPTAFLIVLTGYFVLTSLYSFWLKSKLLVDVMLLTGLFTLRIYAGSAATGIAVSEWLLAFSLFIFFSLALVKRYIEIARMKALGRSDVAGRSYQQEDQAIISTLGSGSGLMAALVLTIYLNDAAANDLYSQPKWLLAATIFLLYWISRIWILAHRGQVDDDPILFAIKDRQSLLIGLLTVLTMWMARL